MKIPRGNSIQGNEQPKQSHLHLNLKKTLEIAIVADGDPEDPHTNSGVALGILTAVKDDTTVRLVGALSSKPQGIKRMLLLALTFRINKNEWKRNFRHSPLTIQHRSRARDRHFRNLPRNAIILNIRNVYLPATQPYVAFIDVTHDLISKSWEGWNGHSNKSVRQLEKIYFENAKHVFTAGGYVRTNVIDHYGISPDKVTAVGGGLNFELMPLNDDFEEYSTKRINILFVGKEFERKGGINLLKAFRMVKVNFPDVTLSVIGCPPQEPIAGVDYLGKIDDRSQMVEHYRQADIFVHPALFEPYGLVIQEAMSFGLPCVGTDIGAIPEIIDHGTTGLIVPPSDAVGLAKALTYLIGHPDERSKMGRKGRTKVEKELTWSAVESRIVDVLKKLELG